MSKAKKFIDEAKKLDVPANVEKTLKSISKGMDFQMVDPSPVGGASAFDIIWDKDLSLNNCKSLANTSGFLGIGVEKGKLVMSFMRGD